MMFRNYLEKNFNLDNFSNFSQEEKYNFFSLIRIKDYIPKSVEMKIPSVKEEYKIFKRNTFICSNCKSVLDKEFMRRVCKKQFCQKDECDIERKKYLKKVRERVEKTCLEKYGYRNANQVPEVREKIKNTVEEKYGGFLNASEIIRSKTKKTKQEKYGDPNFNNREKYKLTNLERFGAENVFSSDVFKEHLKELNLKKYGVEHYSKTNKYRQDWKQTILTKYGTMENYYEIRKNIAIKNHVEKTGFRWKKQEHIKNYDKLNRDGFLEFVKDGVFDIDSVSNFFNLSISHTFKYKRFFNIREPSGVGRIRKQKEIFDKIQADNKILNDRIVLDGKELDIYLPDYNIAIEYNGLMFHSFGISEKEMFNNLHLENSDIHLYKTEECEKLGIQLFHIFEGENLNFWFTKINDKLGINNIIDFGNCYIKNCNDFVNDFQNANYINKKLEDSFNLGLFLKNNIDFNDELISVCSFNYNGDNIIIKDFCNKINFSYKGVIKYFINYIKEKYNFNKIIFEANRRFWCKCDFDGTPLEFEKVKEPRCFTFKYYPFELFNFTEQTPANEGYRKLYDAGYLKYVVRNSNE